MLDMHAVQGCSSPSSVALGLRCLLGLRWEVVPFCRHCMHALLVTCKMISAQSVKDAVVKK